MLGVDQNHKNLTVTQLLSLGQSTCYMPRYPICSHQQEQRGDWPGFKLGSNYNAPFIISVSNFDFFLANYGRLYYKIRRFVVSSSRGRKV